MEMLKCKCQEEMVENSNIFEYGMAETRSGNQISLGKLW